MDNRTFTRKYYIDRSQADTVKWQRGRKENCLPMWVADMDFKCDQKVIDELCRFYKTGDYGYNNLPQDYYDVFNNWQKTNNNITYKNEWIRFSKGAVNAMYQIIHSMTFAKDHILINTPLYPPFKDSIKKTGRRVVESKLINNNGYFTFDYEDIEKKIKEKKVKMLMLCSPHNPIGRVWKRSELDRLFAICRKYKVLVCSDEVHSDIIMPSHKFVPALSLKKYQDMVVSITAASKSFSLAVFSHSHIIVPNEKLRNRLIEYQQLNNCGSVNVSCAFPTYLCYKYAGEWQKNVNNVIYENYQYLKQQLGQYLEMSVLEGSYLVFVNLGKYNKNASAAQCLKENCHLLVNAGETFDKKYNNWVRINLATSLDNVKIATDRILEYIRN